MGPPGFDGCIEIRMHVEVDQRASLKADQILIGEDSYAMAA